MPIAEDGKVENEVRVGQGYDGPEETKSWKTVKSLRLRNMMSFARLAVYDSPLLSIKVLSVPAG